MDVDANTITGLLTVAGTVATGVIVATASRRRSRTEEYDALQRRYDDVVKELDAVRVVLNRLRYAYDHLYVYARTMYFRSLDAGDEQTPPIPKDARDV